MASKKATVKKGATKKRQPRRKAAEPVHPLMLDHKDWNKQKCMDLICDKIATSTYGLGKIIEQCKKEHGKFPGYSTIFLWLKDEEDGKSPGGLIDLYARAKEGQADFMADEILDIADDARNDWMTREGKNGEEYEVLNSEHVQRSKLRIESRKWLAGKLRPRMYGDKIQQEIDHTSSDGSMSPMSLNDFYAEQPDTKPGSS